MKEEIKSVLEDYIEALITNIYSELKFLMSSYIMKRWVLDVKNKKTIKNIKQIEKNWLRWA